MRTREFIFCLSLVGFGGNRFHYKRQVFYSFQRGETQIEGKVNPSLVKIRRTRPHTHTRFKGWGLQEILQEDSAERCFGAISCRFTKAFDRPSSLEGRVASASQRLAGLPAPLRAAPPCGGSACRNQRTPTATLGGDSLSILFNHRAFQKPDPFSLGFRRFSRKKDPSKNLEGTPGTIASVFFLVQKWHTHITMSQRRLYVGYIPIRRTTDWETNHLLSDNWN